MEGGLGISESVSPWRHFSSGQKPPVSSEVKLANNTVTFLKQTGVARAQRSCQATPAVFIDKAVTGCLFALNHPMCCDGDDGVGKSSLSEVFPEGFFPLIWAKLSMCDMKQHEVILSWVSHKRQERNVQVRQEGWRSQTHPKKKASGLSWKLSSQVQPAGPELGSQWVLGAKGLPNFLVK